MPDPEDDDAAFDGAAAGLAGDCANAGIANALTNRTVVSVDMLRFMASPSPDGPLSRNPVLDFEFPPHDKTKRLLSASLAYRTVLNLSGWLRRADPTWDLTIIHLNPQDRGLVR